MIAKDYCLERSNAIKAKRKGDKSGQRQAGLAICKLKQEMNALGKVYSVLVINLAIMTCCSMS